MAKFPFPALLVRPRNWKAQYVTVYSEEGFSFSFESLLMRLHFENNIFVVSRSPRARPIAFNHLETLALRGSYKETFRRGPHNVNKFK